MTPLHNLSPSQYNDEGDVPELALLLLKHGAEVNRRDKSDEAPLHLAIRRTRLKFAGILLEHDEDPDAENNKG